MWLSSSRRPHLCLAADQYRVTCEKPWDERCESGRESCALRTEQSGTLTEGRTPSIGTGSSHCLRFSELFWSNTTSLVCHLERRARPEPLEPFYFEQGRTAYGELWLSPLILGSSFQWSSIRFLLLHPSARKEAKHLLQQGEKLPNMPPSSQMSFIDPGFPVCKAQVSTREWTLGGQNGPVTQACKSGPCPSSWWDTGWFGCQNCPFSPSQQLGTTS